MLAMEELAGTELHPDPVVLELNRLQNHLKDKNRELGNAHGEIKALRATEVLKDKAIEELTSGFEKLEEKLQFNENLLEQKNLEIRKLANEKREALAAQYAAEATLRRVHANQKDDDFLPIETVIAPLEAEIKMYKTQITALQEDIKALERHTKSKEVALLEAEKILRSALERALIVEEVQNHNFELKRQIEICQEENRILDKTNRQKVLEVEKLTGTIKELEEAILAGGAAANAIRDYQRQISELHDENRTLERELARIKVSANRVATVVANEWKDESDKVMPVKQWLEERRLLQAEMQRLREKLVISERTAKAEAQLKDKLKMRLKTLEEGLKHVTSFTGNTNALCGSPKPEKSSHIFGFLSTNNREKKRSTSQPRAASTTSRSNHLQQPNTGNTTPSRELKQVNSFKKTGLWVSRVKVVEKENKEINENTTVNFDKFKDRDTTVSGDIRAKIEDPEELKNKEGSNAEDVVSGFLYDRLQKEVIALRKHCEAKDNTVNAKNEEIKMLMKKVDTLIKAIEVESKKTKREAAAKEKETAMSAKTRSTSAARRVVKAS